MLLSRSQVVREACVSIAFMSQQLQQKMDHFAEAVLNPLIILIPNSAKVKQYFLIINSLICFHPIYLHLFDYTDYGNFWDSSDPLYYCPHSQRPPYSHFNNPYDFEIERHPACHVRISRPTAPHLAHSHFGEARSLDPECCGKRNKGR